MKPWALLYPGDRAMRDRTDPRESRFLPLFEALRTAGIDAVPAIYHDDFADEVETQLMQVAGVQVWCNPIEGGRRRDRLDALLRRVADAGVFVSSHPEAVLRLGTKDVLLATRDLPFGSDAHRIDSPAQLANELPARLDAGARVLKQQRGHSGIGVWRVKWADGGRDQLRIRHAQRGSVEERVGMDGLLARLRAYFDPAADGHLIDQPWQPQMVEGMTRAYLVGDRVGGFGHQAVNALFPASGNGSAPEPGPRLYFDADEPRFQPLRQHLEGGWIAMLREAVSLAPEQLPLLWDCDFLPGSEGKPAVLCEINVSSVSPYPPSCNPLLVDAIRAHLASA